MFIKKFILFNRIKAIFEVPMTVYTVQWTVYFFFNFNSCATGPNQKEDESCAMSYLSK